MITYRLEAHVVSAVEREAAFRCLMLILLLLYLLGGLLQVGGSGDLRAVKDPGRPYRGGAVGLAALLLLSILLTGGLFAWGERM